MAQKIVYWLLIVLVLSLGFGQLLRFEYLGLPIYLHDLLILTILILRGLTLRGPIPRAIKLFLTGLTLGWIFALFYYPLSQLLIPFLYTLRLFAYLALYFLIKKNKLYIPYSIFLLSGLVMLVIGLIQYIFLPDMRIFQYLGWDDHLNRLTLPHFDPTFTAVMLGLFMFTLKRSQWLIGLMVLWQILLTYSRSTWISLLLIGFAFIKNKKILFLFGVVLLISIFALPQKFGEGTNLLRTYSITSRLTSDFTYIKKYQWDLLIGRGFNVLILDSPSLDLPNHASSPNNSYLYLLLTTGVLGLTGWGMFMYSLFQKSTHKPLLVFFFITSVFNNVMFYSFALLWILLTQAMAPSEVSSNSNLRSRPYLQS